MPVSIVDLYSA